MKRAKVIACIAALIIVLSAGSVFAGENFKIEETYPKNGQKSTTVENMSVKLRFNHEIDKKENRKNNDKCFKIIDKNGKKLPVKVLYDTENSKRVVVLVDMTKKDVKIIDNSEYKLKVSEKLLDNDGNRLGEEDSISFYTINQAWNTKVYMIMMFVMFGGMMVFSMLQARKGQAQAEAGDKAEPFNPYKEAKKTGKTVEQVTAEHEKVLAKQKKIEKKNAKRAEKDAKLAKEIEKKVMIEYAKEHRNLRYCRVRKPRPISAAGSTYKTGRKAQAEARKKEEERLAEKRAANKKHKK